MTCNVKISDIISPNYYAVHRAIKNHEYTHYMIDGGRGSLKSSFVSEEIWLLILRNPNINGVVFRKTGTTLRNSVLEQILWAADKLNITHELKITVSPMEIIYKPTGQKILFRGLDDRLKLKSIKSKRGYFGVCWFEELDEFSGMEEIRSVIQSLGRGGEKFWFFYTFNPPKSRDNWVNVEKLIADSSRLYFHSTYLEAPPEWLGSTFIDEAERLKIINPNAYEHEYLGVATGTGGSVFENVISRSITDAEIKTFGYFYYGIDFGFAIDPFVWIKLSFDRKNKRLYILDEIYEIKLKNSTIADKVKSKRMGSMTIFADSAEPKSIAELQAMGLNVYPAVKGQDSIEHGIKWLQDLTEIVIDKNRTPETYKEFVLYEYEQTRDGKYISAYPDKNNHAIDAVRYALNNVIRSSTIEVLSGRGI